MARDEIRQTRAREMKQGQRNGTACENSKVSCDSEIQAWAISGPDFLLCIVLLVSKAPLGTKLSLSNSQVILLCRSSGIY